jgi:CheY-like chemotaxis protein
MESESFPTVLVIDDSQVARAKMSQLLADAGIRVHALPSPIGATRAILANSVNIVVVDVMLPGMRGDRLAALFRSNPRFRNLGVILVSGAAESELESLSMEVRADATLAKSRLTELVPMVRKLSQRLHGG